MKTKRFETLQVHGGYFPEKTTNSIATPIYQSSCYTFDDTDHAKRLFKLEEFGNIYTRLMNPTTDVFEKRIAELEGGSGALAVSSGMAAQFIALNNILENGDNFVTSPFVYGGSHNQFKVSFKRFGIDARFALSDSVSDMESLIDDKTKAIFVESIGNPGFSIPDFKALSGLAKKYDIPFIVDNTFGAAGFLIKPIEFGANIVVEAATKWICGHGTSIGGVIVDGGNFNWGNGKFPCISEPSPSYHGFNFWNNFGKDCPLGNIAYITKARVEGLRDFGPCISPFNSFLLVQGLETLSLRVERTVENTLLLADWLESLPEVNKVNYPGLESSKYHKLAKQYFKRGYGGVLSVVFEGTKEFTSKFVDNLELISHLTNVGDVRTLIVQPSATTHQQLSESDQLSAGVEPSMLRISLGIEHIEDIKNDILNSLSKTKKELGEYAL